TSPIFVGTDALQVQLDAGVRAVQSTPILTRSGELRGMISTHYKTPRAPEKRALPYLDLLARHAADILERARADEPKTFLIGELTHRMKNMLAIIQSIANQTSRATEEPAEFVDRFSARLRALALAHDLLTQHSWQSAPLVDVVRTALEPFKTGERIK